MKRQIDVTIEGGIVQDIQNIPDYWVVKVMDFDVDGCEEEGLENINGDLARVSYWAGAPDHVGPPKEEEKS